MAEDLGYAALLLSDHVADRGTALTALAAATACTDTLVVGTFVLNNELRHPVLLAKEVAALLCLAPDRFVLGLGAGWSADDFRITGLPTSSGSERLSRLRQSVAIVHALLSGEEVAVDGPHYRVQAEAGLLVNEGGRPPRLLLGGARSGTLGLAADHADIVSFVPRLGPEGPEHVAELRPGALDRRLAGVRVRLESRRPRPRLNHVVWECFVTPRPAPVVAALAAATGVAPEEVRQMPAFLVGSPSEVAETLLERRERWGLSFVTVPAAAARAFAPVVARLRGR